MSTLSTKIIYGTAWWAERSTACLPAGTESALLKFRKKEQTTRLVVSAVLNGFKAIDTACQPKHYREDLVGAALLELKGKHNVNREDLFLQTKYTSIAGQDRSQPLPYDPSDPIPKQITTSLQKSLANLHTTYLDSYLLHSPLPTWEQTLEAWHALGALQDAGTVRLIGVSNTYSAAMILRLSAVRKVQVVQNRWFEGNGWDRDVLEVCREQGIMYQSFWTLTGSPSLLGHPGVLKLAKASNMTPAQVVYKFAQSEGITPLSGTSNEMHMREDVAVENSSFAEDEASVNELQAFIRT